MNKKQKHKEDITSCPICNVPIMSSNLSRHISIIHTWDNINKNEKQDKTVNLKKEINQIMEDLRVRRRQRNILSILFVALLIFLPVAYAVTVPTEQLSIPESPNPNRDLVFSPNFSSIDVVTGESISLSQFKGNVILLNFVNYGCNQRTNQIVSKQLLAIKSLTEQRDDFISISVFCGCCPVDTLRNFAEENELSWPWILDSNYFIIREYEDYVKEYGYPTLVFINQDQYIVEFSGFKDVSTLSQIIDKML